MIFEFLTACGKSPSLISGASLAQARKAGADRQCLQWRLRSPGRGGGRERRNTCQIRPRSRGLPNISKDHKSIDEIKGLFEMLVQTLPGLRQMRTIRSSPPFRQQWASAETVRPRGDRTMNSSCLLRSSFFKGHRISSAASGTPQP